MYCMPSFSSKSTLKEVLVGSYSFVAIGATAATYDLLAKPVHRRILFAGEHTCKVSSYCAFLDCRDPNLV